MQDLTYETHNASRDLKRQFLKHTEWPNLYFAPIRVWSLKKQEIETVQLPFLLPHEVVWSLMQKGNPEIFLQQTNILPKDQQHLARAALQMVIANWSNLLPAGLWSDGVPCNWDRSQSLEIWIMNFTAVPDKWRPLRVPLFVIKTRFLQKNVTMDDVFQVLAWSFDALALGCFPRCNHAGQEFSEKFRRKLSGQSLPCRGILTQIRGDWKMLKQMLAFPAHNESARICWKCPCKAQQLREVGLQASWRNLGQPYTEWDFMARFVQEGRHYSKVFMVPFFRFAFIKLDWLHIVDLGVAADCLGNIFWQAQTRMPGNLQQRLQQLFLEMRTYYAAAQCNDRLATLTEGMLRKSATSPPKLKAKGAECRNLVAFAVQIAGKYFTDASKPE